MILYHIFDPVSYFLSCIIYMILYHIHDPVSYLWYCIIYDPVSYLWSCIIFMILYHVYDPMSYLWSCIIFMILYHQQTEFIQSLPNVSWREKELTTSCQHSAPCWQNPYARPVLFISIFFPTLILNPAQMRSVGIVHCASCRVVATLCVLQSCDGTLCSAE